MSRTCPSCGSAAARTAFCTSCGQPLREGRRNPWFLVAGAAAGVVVLAVVGVLLLQPAQGAADDEASGSTAPTSSSVAAPSRVGGATGAPYSPYLSGPTTRTPRSAASELRSIAATDASRVDALEGYWVAQVSSKRDGLAADGIVYDDDAILAEHERLAGQYPGTVLFESDRFASYTSSGFWISAIAVPYSTAADANAWCDSAGLPADACFAKRLTQTAGARNTVPR